MSLAPDPSDKTDAKTDAKADGNFGSAGGSHRAGYGDKLANAERWARKGGTLNAGEGLILCEEIDLLRKELEIATSMLGSKSRLINGLQDENDRLRVENNRLHQQYLTSCLVHRYTIHQLMDANARLREALEQPLTDEAIMKRVADDVGRVVFNALNGRTEDA